MADTTTPLYTTNSIISKDGTRIGYRQLGGGPGVIIVHGGMQGAQNFMKLAAALADQFTLYIPDRRGRGLSGEPGLNYGIEKECEDIEALLDKTGAHYIFGLSSGAIISLNAALRFPAIQKAAIYEPPFPIDKTTPDYRFINRYHKEIAQNNIGAAFITVVTGLQLSFLLGLIPRFIMTPLANMLMKRDEEQLQPGDIPLKDLVPCFKYDYLLVDETKGELEKFRQVETDILLLSGSKSPVFLKQVITRLKAILSNNRHIEFKGLDHMGSDNTGKPEVIAEELRRFFGK